MDLHQRRRYVAVAVVLILIGGGAIISFVFRAMMMGPKAKASDAPDDAAPNNATRLPSNAPTTLPLNPQNSTQEVTTSGLTSSRPTEEEDGDWYPAAVNGEETCIYGYADDYGPGFPTEWLFESELKCCEHFQLGNCMEKYIVYDDKFFPAQTESGRRFCDYGTHYPPNYEDMGILFDTEIDCCKHYAISHCIPRESAHFPVEIDGVKACAFDVPPEGYPSFPTRQECCENYPGACPKVATIAYFPEEVDGVKTCTYDVHPEHYSDDMIFDSRDSCCEKYPEACPTTTLATTTTPRPPVVAPPCETSLNGKECGWWPEVTEVREDEWIMVCNYSSEWPDEAEGHVYPDNDGSGHETCCLKYDCTLNDDGSYASIDDADV